MTTNYKPQIPRNARPPQANPTPHNNKNPRHDQWRGFTVWVTRCGKRRCMPDVSFCPKGSIELPGQSRVSWPGRDSANVCPITPARAAPATARAPSHGWPCVRNACRRARESTCREPVPNFLDTHYRKSFHALLLHVRRGGENRKKGKRFGCHDRVASVSSSRRRIPASCPFLEAPFRRTSRAACRCGNSLVVDLPPSGRHVQSTLGGNGRNTGQPCLRD